MILCVFVPRNGVLVETFSPICEP